MNSPKVSVIIPTYNYANYVGEAIQSVLDQSFSDFEVIVVDDGSIDHTAEVVRRFSDTRVKYIFQENRGLPAARNTGIKASSGELLAFLDSDDKFHPDKLQTQVAFLKENPDVGLTYNSKFLVDSAGNCLSLRRSPATVTLADLVLGYPFAPSDVVIRREWAFRVSLFDESFVLNSEDLNFHLRLALEGCKFAGVEQALAYRQIHTGRVFKNLAAKLETMLRALDTVFLDPRCPADVLALRDIAYANHYMTWAYQASVQAKTTLAQEYFREMIRLNPAILDNEAKSLLAFLIHASIHDGGEHESALRRIFAQLPPEMAWLSEHGEWALGREYLQRGGRDVMWGREKAGHVHFSRAAELGAQLDEQFLRNLTDQLLNYEMAFPGNGQKVLQKLTPYLKKVGPAKNVRWLRGCYALNRAFQDYQARQYSKVPSNTLRAIFRDPTYLANRGVIAMLVCSMVGLMKPNVSTAGA